MVDELASGKFALKKGSKMGSKVNIDVPVVVVDPDALPVKGGEAPTNGVPQESPLEPKPKLKPNKPSNPIVYFDITINKEFEGRIWFELFKNVVPKTAENFRGLCTGEYGMGSSGSFRWFRHSELFRVIPKVCIQGGDFVRNNGMGGESIYGELFVDENFELKHTDFGMLSMANSGKSNTNGSQFFITLAPCPWLDGRHVVFGQVIKGEEVVRKIEANGSKRGCPKYLVKIENCGQMPLNIEQDPTRPNWLEAKILHKNSQFPSLNLPQPSMYLPSVWQRKNNSISSDMRRRIKDLQVCITKAEALRLELHPKKTMYVTKKRMPLHAIGTKQICIINPFSMERNLSYRWKISPFAQADHDKILDPYQGTSEVPDEKTMHRMSELMLEQGKEAQNILFESSEKETKTKRLAWMRFGNTQRVSQLFPRPYGQRASRAFDPEPTLEVLEATLGEENHLGNVISQEKGMKPLFMRYGNTQRISQIFPKPFKATPIDTLLDSRAMRMLKRYQNHSSVPKLILDETTRSKDLVVSKKPKAPNFQRFGNTMRISQMFPKASFRNW